MKIKIITTGKKSPTALQQLQDDYQKRLQKWTAIQWQIPGNGSSVAIESDAVLRVLGANDFVILLDEQGTQWTSEEMAASLDTWMQHGRSLVFVIGGSHGVSDKLKNRADVVWSLSTLVFPHQIVRLLLVEQLYRMFTIRHGGSYHHS